MEIFNGIERRRRWPDDEKMRIIEETFAPGAKVSEIARRQGVGRSVLFAGDGRQDRVSLADRRLRVWSRSKLMCPVRLLACRARLLQRRGQPDRLRRGDALGRVLDVLSCR